MRTLFIFIALALFTVSCGTARPTGSTDKTLKIAGVEREVITDSDGNLGEYALAWRGTKGSASSPISLTASDGTGLEMVSLTARAAISDPLAFTELHIVFHNPEDRVREGRFEIALPPGSALSRFAMMIEGKWQEAEVVERQAARRAYEDFLHRRQDPALMEKKAGNQFRARVFPIPAKANKEFIVSFSQEMRGAADPYVLMLRGLPKLKTLDVDVLVSDTKKSPVASSVGGESVHNHHLLLKKDNFEPDRDLEVMIPRSKGPLAIGNKDLVVARVTPKIDQSHDSINGLTILFDTSASRAVGFEAQVDRLGEIIKALSSNSKNFNLTVACFDQTVEEVFKGKANGFDKKIVERIKKRRALGASNLEGALKWAWMASRNERVLLFTDGITTTGLKDAGALENATVGLKKKGVRRLDAIVDGGIRDEEALRGIVDAGLENTGVVVDAGEELNVIANKLTRATVSETRVHVEHAKWQWPYTFSGLQAGDEVLVFAQIPEDKKISIRLDGPKSVTHNMDAIEVPRPLIERAAVRAQIDKMTFDLGNVGDPKGRERLKHDIIDNSIRYRVVSDLTALLVLETEDDYARFNIDRNALSDILEVGPAGVVLTKRLYAPKPVLKIAEEKEKKKKDIALAASPRASTSVEKTEYSFDDDAIEGDLMRPDGEMVRLEETAITGVEHEESPAPESPFGDDTALAADSENAMGALMGNDVAGESGRGGLADGSGRASSSTRSRQARIPRIRTAAPQVRGSLSGNVIRRVVHRSMNRIKHCYEREELRNPGLEGRVTLKMIIDARGRVKIAKVEQSTLGNANVENCVVSVAKRWRFPAPEGGGIVAVTYPIMFVPNTDEASDEDEQEGRIKPFTDNAYEGRFAEIMSLITNGDNGKALEAAWQWRDEDPGDVLAIVALGEAAESMSKLWLAMRAYGSIIDLFPSRADMLRMAGERLERIGQKTLPLVIDTYKTAVEQRPDHPSSHRLYAFALLKDNRPKEAFMALAAGLDNEYPGGRFAGVRDLLKEDLGIIAAAWKKMHPEDKAVIVSELKKRDATLAIRKSTMFVLNWESDANDVDLHIYDNRRGHAYYSDKELKSGGYLIADVTDGYGPECFMIRGKPRAYPYVLQAHYYNRGPMGYGMGKLQIITHDGKGGMEFSEHPFVVMKDGSYITLAVHEKAKSLNIAQ